jgi:polar amino acid transport system substrate-binding protein
VDCIIIDKQPALKLVEANEGKAKVLDFAPTDEVEAYALAVSKDDEALLADVNAAIDTIKANGTYDQLFAKYISGEDVTLPEIPAYTATGTLIVGTNAEFEPFEYRNDKNEITGFDMDMMKYIGAELKRDIQIEDMNFDGLIAALQTGKIDIIAAGMTNTEERGENVNFTQD